MNETLAVVLVVLGLALLSLGSFLVAFFGVFWLAAREIRKDRRARGFD